MRLLPAAAKASVDQQGKRALWRALGRVGGPELERLALDRLNAEFHAKEEPDEPEKRAALAISLLEFDPGIPDRQHVIAVAFRSAAETSEWSFSGPSRRDLLQSLSSLLTGTETRWALGQLGEIGDAKGLAEALAAIAPVVAREDLDVAIGRTADLAPWPSVYGKAVTPLVARLRKLGEEQRARELADTVEDPDWRIRSSLELLLAHPRARPADLIEVLSQVVAVTERKLTHISEGSRSWQINAGWKSEAAQRILTALAEDPRELLRAVEIIHDGGLLPGCSQTIAALATQTKAGTRLPGLLWCWTLDSLTDKRSTLIDALAGLQEIGRLLSPEFTAQDLGDMVLDILRGWS